MNTPILEVSGIKKIYGKKEVLGGVSFSMNRGEVLSIIGSSGSGNMKWSIYYSTDADFSNPTPIGDIPDGVTSNGE